MTTLVFQHGWGYDAEFLKPLACLLPDFKAVHLDSGYFGPPRMLPADVTAAVGIGHSRGFRCLLAASGVRWLALVSIGGFSRFVRDQIQSQALAAMLAAYQRKPARVVKAFHRRADAPYLPAGSPEYGRLGDDLKGLADFDRRMELEQTQCPVLALHAQNDAIVPLHQAERDFEARTFIPCPEGGHGLGLNNARWCANRIREFLAANEP